LILVHYTFKIRHLVATILTIFSKMCQLQRNDNQNRKVFFFSSVAVGLFLEWA